MKNSVTFCMAITLLIFVGLACKNNPLAKFTNQYHCTIEGESEPQTADEYFKRAEKHLESHNASADFDQCAFDAVSEGLKLDPQNAIGYGFRGNLYMWRAKEFVSKNDTNGAKKDFESALDDLNEAIRLEPNRSIFYDQRSVIYRDSGFLDTDLEKALQDLSKSIELYKSLYPYEERGDIYAEKKDYENAVKDYSEAIKLDPKISRLYTKRSEAYKNLGKTDLADKDEFKSLQIKFPAGNSNSNTSEIPGSNKKEIPKTISGGVLNGKAIDLPKPEYPVAARTVKASGAVNVQVTVDEKGDVVSASAVSGHPLLRASAVAAAKNAKFNPTLLSGKPVKISGVVVYNFTP